MKFGVVNKSTIVNRFALHTLQRNITHLAVITRKTKIKLGILKGGGTGKVPRNLFKTTLQVINCSKTCQREQVNKCSQHFLHAKCRVNSF